MIAPGERARNSSNFDKAAIPSFEKYGGSKKTNSEGSNFQSSMFLTSS